MVDVDSWLMTSEFGEKRPDFGEQVTSASLYRDLLIKATFNDRNRSIGNDITAIDFSGAFAETANKLNRLTQSDPSKREHGTIAYATPAGKVLIRNSIAQGNTDSISLHIEIRPNFGRFFLGISYGQDNFFASMIHSHAIDSPASPLDLSHLLLSGKDFAALTSTFIVTPARKIVVFRGAQTPQLSQKEVKTKLDLWTKQVDERVTHFTKPDMDSEQIDDIKAKAQHAMLRQIIKKYDLKYFTCPAAQTIARLNLQGEL